jgi:hypothetical protein
MRGLSHCRFCKQHHGSAEADTTWRVERDQEHTILHLAEVRESVREGSSLTFRQQIPAEMRISVQMLNVGLPDRGVNVTTRKTQPAKAGVLGTATSFSEDEGLQIIPVVVFERM